MAEIATTEVDEILGSLPEIVPWSDALLANSETDLLLCCAGFEERSTASVRDLVCGTIGVIYYSTNAVDNSKSIAEFQKLGSSTPLLEIGYERSSFVSALRTALLQFKNRTSLRVTVDVSGMASFVFYRVLATIFDELPQAELGIYYAEALDYAPTHQEWESFFNNVPAPRDNLSIAERYEESHFQSRGVDVTYESDVFPGENVGPLGTEVIAIPSFSLQRMKSMLCHVESQYSVQDEDVRWFFGQPPDRVRNGWRYDALAALYNVRERGIGVSTRDYKDILQRLDRRWEEIHTKRHLIIATLGSKMQHLGCFLFLRMHPECGLLLCEPREFIADRYSTGIGPRWWLELGRVQWIRALLATRGELRFQWPG